MYTPTEPTPASQVALAQRILGMTRATHRKLSPQVLNVVRALRGAGRPIDGGFQPEEVAAAPSLKAAKTVEMLQATFAEDAAGAARVEEVIGRFQQVGETLGAMEAAIGRGAVSQDELDALQQAALFLGKFHEAVKGDPLLAQLFPPPEILMADAADAL